VNSKVSQCILPDVGEAETLAPFERDDISPASGDLELLRGFLTLYDHRPGVGDSLPPSAATLAGWLRGRSLIPAELDPSVADLRWALEALEAMRERVSENVGATVPDSAVRRLNDAAREAGVELRFANGGATRFEAGAPGVRGAIGRLLGIAFLAELDGSWAHFKECDNPRCRGVFFDRSKNHSGKWCSMRTCGNRAKVRRFRERRTATS
jgi:predicted RNA-binding Zn ribbon-like protein